MARVIMPLMGVSATGKLGNAIVYMPIAHAKDGLVSVRRWLSPKQANSEDQGDIRLYVKSVGHGMKFISTGGELQTEIAAVTPAPQLWNAYFLKTCFGGAMAQVIESLSVYASLAAGTVKWSSHADSVGMHDQDITYASISPITAGEILFVHARGGYDLQLSITPKDAQLLTHGEILSFVKAYYSLC